MYQQSFSVTKSFENSLLKIQISVCKGSKKLKEEVKHINCSVTLLLSIYM